MMTSAKDFTDASPYSTQMVYTQSVQRTFGILAPKLWYCWGFFRKLTNSRISTLASSQPATSLNRTPVLSFTILALDSLMLKGFPGPLPPRPPNSGPRRVANITNASSAKEGRTLKRSLLREEEILVSGAANANDTGCCGGDVSCRLQMHFSPIALSAVVNGNPLCRVQTHLSLGHLKVVFKWINTSDVEPQIVLKHTDTTMSLCLSHSNHQRYW